MQTAISFIKRHKLETAIIAGIILLAAFLRLYQIGAYVIFLGDEGRDALVVKRMIVDHDLTLLGPTASVGGFYLGPVYYYMMIPAMILSGLHPVGPAIMIALMGTATVALLYYILRSWFGVFPAAISSLLYAVSPGVVGFSRSSWNPNPMPLFALLAVFLLHLAIKHRKLWLTFLSAVCMGIIIQLHYLGLVMAPVLLAILFIEAKPKTYLKNITAATAGFLVGASMYLAFEIRHGFPNIRSVIEFVSRGGSTTGLRNPNIFWLFFDINRFNLEAILSKNLVNITAISTYFLLGSILIFFLFRRSFFKQSTPAQLINLLKTNFVRIKNPDYAQATQTVLIYWLVGIIGISLYKGQLHYHYFQFLFPAPFLLLGLVLSAIHNKKTQLVLASFFIIFSAYLLRYQPFVVAQGSNLVRQTQTIAAKVAELSGGEAYNFALITPGNSDHAYRFFLEKDHLKPTPLEERVESQLLVVCEQEPDTCEPRGHPVWGIAGFGRAEIVDTDIVPPGITVFRLVHHPDSIDLIGKPAPQGGN